MQFASTYIVVHGDSTTIVGQKLDGNELFVGRLGIGVRNKRGSRLPAFAASNRLHIMNICFQKQRKRQWAWRSPDDKARNQIDHRLLDTKTIQ